MTAVDTTCVTRHPHRRPTAGAQVTTALAAFAGLTLAALARLTLAVLVWPAAVRPTLPLRILATVWRVLTWPLRSLARALLLSMVAVAVAGPLLMWVSGYPAADPLKPGPARMTGYTDTAPCRRVSGGRCDVRTDVVHIPATGPVVGGGGG